MTLLVGLSVVSLACGSSALLVQVALGVAGITVLP
jgi:hypothetical protein